MQAKSGKKISIVKPVTPEAALDADEADAGKVAKMKAKQISEQSGKYGKQPVKPFKPKKSAASEQVDEKKTSWIEIEMLDEADQPVPGMKYEVKLPDGTVATGVTDGKGYARVDGCEEGNCEITFPDLDKGAWEKA